MFFVFFPKKLTHILSKLILIFFPFLCLPFLFFFFLFSCIFLASKPKKFSFTNPKNFHTQKKTFKPQHYLIKLVPLTSKSQTFLSLPKLSQLFQTPWLASSTHCHYRHHHNWRFLFFSFSKRPTLSPTILSNSNPKSSNSL